MADEGYATEDAQLDQPFAPRIRKVNKLFGAIRLLLAKCFDIKMVGLTLSLRGVSILFFPPRSTNQQKLKSKNKSTFVYKMSYQYF